MIMKNMKTYRNKTFCCMLPVVMSAVLLTLFNIGILRNTARLHLYTSSTRREGTSNLTVNKVVSTTKFIKMTQNPKTTVTNFLKNKTPKVNRSFTSKLTVNKVVSTTKFIKMTQNPKTGTTVTNFFKNKTPKVDGSPKILTKVDRSFTSNLTVNNVVSTTKFIKMPLNPKTGVTDFLKNKTPKIDGLPKILTKVAITCTLTTKGQHYTDKNSIQKKSLLFTQLTKSICNTASVNYNYGLYITYDKDDPWLTKPNFLESFKRAFLEFTNIYCRPKGVKLGLKLMKVGYNNRIAWSQNDAGMEAYYDGYDYIYRVNDDVVLKTPGWTEGFIWYLNNTLHPPNVGATCPDHRGDNQEVWQFDFVHRRHIEIHGVYYPRIFYDWKDTDWITFVYGSRGNKTMKVKIHHTMSKGQRYNAVDPYRIKKQRFDRVLNYGKYLISQYIKALPLVEKNKHQSGKVIVYPTNANSTDKIYGIIRNAQLARIFFPSWIVRFYIERSNVSPAGTNHTTLSDGQLMVLKQMNARIIYTNNHTKWYDLLADDKNVVLFIVRNVESRLSGREAKMVEYWEKSSTFLHFIQEVRQTKGYKTWCGDVRSWTGSWGANHHEFVTFVRKSASDCSIQKMNISNTLGLSPLEKTIMKHTLVHMGAKITKCEYGECKPTPSLGENEHYVSQRFMEYEVPK